MGLRKPSFEEEDGANVINISPLIDVIFILLIFFIVTMSFADNSALSIERPASSQAQNISAQTPVTIKIAESGALAIGSEIVSLRRLKSILENRAALGDFDVLIDSSAQTPVQSLVEVMDCAKAAGAKTTYIAAKKK